MSTTNSKGRWLLRKRLLVVLPPTLAALFFCLGSVSAHAGDTEANLAGSADKPVNGCYQANWFYPWLDLPSTNCTHPALGDPDHIFDVKEFPTPKEHHCPYAR